MSLHWKKLNKTKWEKKVKEIFSVCALISAPFSRRRFAASIESLIAAQWRGVS